MQEIDCKIKANTFRDQSGLGRVDPINIPSLLLKLKITAVFKPLSDNFSGMAVKIDKHSFILINSNHSIGRQNFTIGHELYHLFIQEDFETHFCKAGNFNKSDIQEYYADLFSSALLMPDDGILEKIPTAEQNKNKISLATVLELENYFGCSRTALLYKLKMMKKIDADKYDEFRKDIKSTARLNGYDIALYSKGREGIIISDYGTKARELFDKEAISESHYASLMKDIGIDIFDESNFENDKED